LEAHHDKLEGSCQWIEDREDFKQWRDSANELDTIKRFKPSIYWATANPGAGKTVLVTHVASQLAEFGLQRATYHFQSGKKESQTLAGLLRSVAFQIAVSNSPVRDMLARVSEDPTSFDLDDARAIWSKVFRSGILRVCMQCTAIVVPSFGSIR
jgi:hypothetical protein